MFLERFFLENLIIQKNSLQGFHDNFCLFNNTIIKDLHGIFSILDKVKFVFIYGFVFPKKYLKIILFVMKIQKGKLQNKTRLTWAIFSISIEFVASSASTFEITKPVHTYLFTIIKTRRTFVNIWIKAPKRLLGYILEILFMF